MIVVALDLDSETLTVDYSLPWPSVVVRSMADEWLCQSCLRPTGCLDRDNRGGEGPLCVCGGETCRCGSCMDTLRLLRAGCLDYHKLGLLRPIFRWSEAEGCGR